MNSRCRLPSESATLRHHQPPPDLLRGRPCYDRLSVSGQSACISTRADLLTLAGRGADARAGRCVSRKQRVGAHHLPRLLTPSPDHTAAAAMVCAEPRPSRPSPCRPDPARRRLVRRGGCPSGALPRRCKWAGHSTQPRRRATAA